MSKSVFTDANRVVIQVLVTARKTAGLRQEDVAVRLGKPQSFISRIESGQRRVDVIEFYAIALAMNADAAALYAEVVKHLPTDVNI
jgi:transcriptional regulator with XRE-family HTH domain